MLNQNQPLGSETVPPSSPGLEEKPETPGIGDKDVHTLPEKFLVGEPRAKKSNRFLIIIITVLSALLLAGGALLFMRLRNPAANTNTVTTSNANANTNTASNANANANTNSNANTNTVNATVLLPTIVKGTLADPETNAVLGNATITLPAQSVPSSVKTVAITTLSPKIGAYATSSKYQAVGGVYILTPSGTTLSKKATLELTYTDQELLSLDFAVEEEKITVATWDGTEWEPVNSLVDQTKNTVTVEIGEFPTDGYALVIEKPASTNRNTNANTNTSIVPSLDSDTDGLTNQEEVLYGTNAGSADTDLDSFRDGQEVLALYNPNGAGRLFDSALVRLYENTTFRYSLYFPPSWTVGTLNADKLITFTSITGEFVQVSIQDNPSGRSAREWYLSLNPSVDQSKLKDIAVANLTGILGPDSLNVYLADAATVYQITYNIGVKTEANYLTTFTMMYTSFKANITPSATNQNTNSSTNANANANTNNNSNTNATTNTNTTNTNGGAGNSNTAVP